MQFFQSMNTFCRKSSYMSTNDTWLEMYRVVLMRFNTQHIWSAFLHIENRYCVREALLEKFLVFDDQFCYTEDGVRNRLSSFCVVLWLGPNRPPYPLTLSVSAVTVSWTNALFSICPVQLHVWVSWSTGRSTVLQGATLVFWSLLLGVSHSTRTILTQWVGTFDSIAFLFRFVQFVHCWITRNKQGMTSCFYSHGKTWLITAACSVLCRTSSVRRRGWQMPCMAVQFLSYQEWSTLWEDIKSWTSNLIWMNILRNIVDVGCLSFLDQLKDPECNETQKGALSITLREIGNLHYDSSSICAITGPPGTGMSTCISLLVGSILYHTFGGHIHGRKLINSL